MSVKIQADRKVTDSLLVKCYEVDSAKKLKPTAFMDMAQEMAYQAAAVMHFGYDELIAKGMAWVLSRMHIRFLDTPNWGDAIEIKTWHRGAFGPFFVRDFEVIGANGLRCIEATSSWVVIDVNSRTMARPEDVLPSEDTACHDAAIETPSAKVMMPRGVEPEFVMTHKVAYSDIDLVGHTNNVRYIAMAMDCMGFDGNGLSVSEIEVIFHHESKLSDQIDLYRHTDGDITFVEGRCNGSQTFFAKLKTVL